MGVLELSFDEIVFDDSKTTIQNVMEVPEEKVVQEIKNGLIIENELVDIPNEDYHSHREYISASQIKDLLKNPYLFFHPQPHENKEIFDVGSAIHGLILEPENFEKDFAIAPSVNKRTIKGREEWQSFKNANKDKTVLSKENYDNCKAIQETVLGIPEVVNMLGNGVSEKSFFKTEDDGTMKKVRPDRYREDIGLILDVKSCVDSSADAFKKDIAKFMYHVQASYYIDTLKANDFVFIAVEKKPPYMTAMYRLTREDLDRGRELIDKALEISKKADKYKSPLRIGSNGDVVQTLVLPTYIHYDNEN